LILQTTIEIGIHIVQMQTAGSALTLGKGQLHIVRYEVMFEKYQYFTIGTLQNGDSGLVEDQRWLPRR
jgi:hypothetical protein